MKNYKDFNKRFLSSTDIAIINVFTNQELHQISTGTVFNSKKLKIYNAGLHGYIFQILEDTE